MYTTKMLSDPSMTISKKESTTQHIYTYTRKYRIESRMSKRTRLDPLKPAFFWLPRWYIPCKSTKRNTEISKAIAGMLRDIDEYGFPVRVYDIYIQAKV